MKKLSLKLRLIISFTAAAIIILGGAGILSWAESREQIDEFFDTYQLVLGRQLAAADWHNIQPTTQHRIDQLIDNLDNDGEEDDEALGFAVFDTQGKMIFNDGNKGKRFSFRPQASGFENQKIGKRPWRLMWIQSVDKNYRIAVGQEVDYRDDAAFDLIEEMLGPWFLGLGLLLLMIIFLVHMELRPLRRLAADLSKRSPDDLAPIDETSVPQEIIPLVQAMNHLFARIEDMFRRERSFISDSAHELRSPLTALKVQLEVAEMSDDDTAARKKALQQLREGIDRSAHLVEQLLALSRLDSSSAKDCEEILDWNLLLKNAIEAQQSVTGKDTKIKVLHQENCSIRCGQGVLWSLLLRNLLDNAVRYSPADTEIKIDFSDNGLTISNSGVELSEDHLSHLGERFFRPAGQKVRGSGLGLSIVNKIAQLHGYHARYECKNGIFKAIIMPD